jgi:hypothetical protein
MFLLFDALSFLSKLEGLNMILTWATMPWASDNGFPWLIQSRLLFLSMSPRFLGSININTKSYVTLHGLIDTSDSNIHLPFSITSGTLTPSLPLALLWCMVHRGQALVDHSSITIMIHMTLYPSDELMLIILCNVDIDEYIFMSWIYFMETIDMRHTRSIYSLLSHLMKFFLSLWHSRCAIKLTITYVLMNK